jgi:NAD(P)-dependent dehydrogenase (short-subunit alcohol dehydrogenase family)
MQQRVVVITGASAGIGVALAEILGCAESEPPFVTLRGGS